jgi:site-specific recombinase XerC
MRIYKPKWPDGRGGYKTCGKFYIELRATAGTVLRFPAFRDEASSTELGRKIARLVALNASGTAIDPTLAAAIQKFPPRLRARLEKHGLVDARRSSAARPIAELVGEFQRSLEARERSKKQVQQVVSRVWRVLDAANVRSWNDLDALKVERVLKAERDKGKSIQSRNHYLGAIRQFVRWALSAGIAAEDPLSPLKPLNVRLDRRHVRRALDADTLRHLLRCTAEGPVREGLSGPMRSLLYRTALETGLRANELRSLRTASLRDLDTATPTVIVQAADSKHRREDVLPLRPELARELADAVRGRGAWHPVFPLNKSWRPCAMLKADLERAKIPYRDVEDRVVDFHALRCCFLSGLAGAGVQPRTLQALARHSSPLLTYSTYVKLGKDDERRALDALPSFDFRGPAPERAVR